jgi:NAD(P)-dependent dehydrogenase (short-subunit alcohol dehydrogenase family)
MANELANQVALITGAGTGIGKGIATAFARAGASVALTGRRKDVVEAAAQELRSAGAKALAIGGDMAKPADAQRAVEETVKAFGALHVLVNNAGIAAFGSLEATSAQDLDAIVDIDLKGPMHTTRAALPHLKKHKQSGGASIIHISSSAALIGMRGFAVYSAAKAGLNQLTRCMAMDYGADQVRVNAICPGVVETPIFDGVPAAMRKKMLDDLAQKHALGRIGTPEDIAAMALFLASRAANWITGAVLPVDGGISLG